MTITDIQAKYNGPISKYSDEIKTKNYSILIRDTAGQNRFIHSIKKLKTFENAQALLVHVDAITLVGYLKRKNDLLKKRNIYVEQGLTNKVVECDSQLAKQAYQDPTMKTVERNYAQLINAGEEATSLRFILGVYTKCDELSNNELQIIQSKIIDDSKNSESGLYTQINRLFKVSGTDDEECKYFTALNFNLNGGRFKQNNEGELYLKREVFVNLEELLANSPLDEEVLDMLDFEGRLGYQLLKEEKKKAKGNDAKIEGINKYIETVKSKAPEMLKSDLEKALSMTELGVEVLRVLAYENMLARQKFMSTGKYDAETEKKPEVLKKLQSMLVLKEGSNMINIPIPQRVLDNPENIKATQLKIEEISTYLPIVEKRLEPLTSKIKNLEDMIKANPSNTAAKKQLDKSNEELKDKIDYIILEKMNQVLQNPSKQKTLPILLHVLAGEQAQSIYDEVIDPYFRCIEETNFQHNWLKENVEYLIVNDLEVTSYTHQGFINKKKEYFDLKNQVELWRHAEHNFKEWLSVASKVKSKVVFKDPILSSVVEGFQYSDNIYDATFDIILDDSRGPPLATEGDVFFVYDGLGAVGKSCGSDLVIFDKYLSPNPDYKKTIGYQHRARKISDFLGFI